MKSTFGNNQPYRLIIDKVSFYTFYQNNIHTYAQHTQTPITSLCDEGRTTKEIKLTSNDKMTEKNRKNIKTNQNFN